MSDFKQDLLHLSPDEIHAMNQELAKKAVRNFATFFLIKYSIMTGIVIGAKVLARRLENQNR